MYEKPLEEKLDELISLLKAVDTKILFLQQDVEELKQQTQTTSDMVVALMSTGIQTSNHSGADKQARLEEFRKTTARW